MWRAINSRPPVTWECPWWASACSTTGLLPEAIDKDGAQQAFYPYNDPGQLPITPVRQPNGDLLRLEIGLPGYAVWLRAWQARVGRATLYLLDSNDAANAPFSAGSRASCMAEGRNFASSRRFSSE